MTLTLDYLDTGDPVPIGVGGFRITNFGPWLTMTELVMPIVFTVCVGSLAYMTISLRKRNAERLAQVESGSASPVTSLGLSLVLLGFLCCASQAGMRWLFHGAPTKSAYLTRDFPDSWLILLTLLPLITTAVIAVAALAISTFAKRTARKSNRLESVGDSV
ncbi:hypothetical protein GS966_25580 [Rhodococcus hoagii]|nr:hypothetical protein [Prescottella equi]NKS61621.1 hypothetical protein [Prescottella equi]NKZ93274.1 hypothetical protein [Prescottella equi]